MNSPPPLTFVGRCLSENKQSRVVTAQTLSNCSCGASQWVQSLQDLRESCPTGALKTPFPHQIHAPEEKPKERDTHRFSRETSGSNFSIISLGSSRGTGRSSERQKKPVLIQSPHRGFVLFNNIPTEKQLPCRTDRVSMPKEHLGSLGTKSEFTRD